MCGNVPAAQEAIDGLTSGDLLHILPDPQNDHDTLALLLRTDDYRLVGFVPGFLASVVHRSAQARSWRDAVVAVEHVGERAGPVHLRLLCRLEVPWPFAEAPFSGPEFDLVEPGWSAASGSPC